MIPPPFISPRTGKDWPSEITALPIGRDTHEPNHYRNFDERPYHGCKRHARSDSEYSDRNCNCEFKVVACRRKCQCR